eukprot:5068625-Prymnesium_polylepis.2
MPNRQQRWLGATHRLAHLVCSISRCRPHRRAAGCRRSVHACGSRSSPRIQPRPMRTPCRRMRA